MRVGFLCCFSSRLLCCTTLLFPYYLFVAVVFTNVRLSCARVHCLRSACNTCPCKITIAAAAFSLALLPAFPGAQRPVP